MTNILHLDDYATQCPTVNVTMNNGTLDGYPIEHFQGPYQIISFGDSFDIGSTTWIEGFKRPNKNCTGTCMVEKTPPLEANSAWLTPTATWATRWARFSSKSTLTKDPRPTWKP